MSPFASIKLHAEPLCHLGTGWPGPPAKSDFVLVAVTARSDESQFQRDSVLEITQPADGKNRRLSVDPQCGCFFLRGQSAADCIHGHGCNQAIFILEELVERLLRKLPFEEFRYQPRRDVVHHVGNRLALGEADALYFDDLFRGLQPQRISDMSGCNFLDTFAVRRSGHKSKTL